MISLNNEWAPIYRGRHPHCPSSSFPWVPTYDVEYLQGASVPFSCFYNDTSTDTIVVVVVVNINFLSVAERNNLLILLAVPAVLAVILLVLPAVLAVLLLVLLVLLTSQSLISNDNTVSVQILKLLKHMCKFINPEVNFVSCDIHIRSANVQITLLNCVV